MSASSHFSVPFRSASVNLQLQLKRQKTRQIQQKHVPLQIRYCKRCPLSSPVFKSVTHLQNEKKPLTSACQFCWSRKWHDWEDIQIDQWTFSAELKLQWDYTSKRKETHSLRWEETTGGLVHVCKKSIYLKRQGERKIPQSALQLNSAVLWTWLNLQVRLSLD